MCNQLQEVIKILLEVNQMLELYIHNFQTMEAQYQAQQTIYQEKQKLIQEVYNLEFIHLELNNGVQKVEALLHSIKEIKLHLE